MYGDDDDSGAEDARPLSFIAGKYGGDHLEQAQKLEDQSRLRLVRTISDQTSPATQSTAQTNGSNGSFSLKKAQTFPTKLDGERGSANDRLKGPLPQISTTPSLRDVPTSQFPVRNIDNSNDIALELSNLQALRRMSMDVGSTTDPDLLQFSSMSLMEMPSMAPSGDDDEDDPSRLLWVPARVHPELEPTAFKNFLEKRVQTMKRRSGDSFLSVDGLQRNDSGSLRRKKSMLSRQVNPSSENGEGYVDGAEKLARQRTLSEHPLPEFSLSELVNDQTGAAQTWAHDLRQEDDEADSPIISVGPGAGLRRSKKTTYRKGGSQRYGERVPFSKRLASKQSDNDSNEEPPPVPPVDPSIGKPLVRVQSEPVAENFSRPTRTVRRQQNFSKESNDAAPYSTTLDDPAQKDITSPAKSSSPPSKHTLPAGSTSTSTSRAPAPPVPQIIETPPTDDTPQPAQTYPQRSSSQKASEQEAYPENPPVGPPARSSKRPGPGKPPQVPAPPAQPSSVKEQGLTNEKALGEINHPHPLPGSGGTTTSSLTFIPTFDAVEKKVDRRSKDKDTHDTGSIASHKSTSSWKWFKSDDKEKKKREKEKEKEREREREREKEREREEQAKQAKAKTGEKSHDNARLDVIQSSIDNVPKGRESLRLDRDSLDSVPHEERKKETNRKSSEGKKDREGFFGGLFGGSRRKGEKDSSHKKKDQRPLTPEPPLRPLQPDVDYAWSRFPIIEERAIYRMAHIKLANPRRSLHSQVLLSNFMYSYLAKVQAMHPQLQIPVSPQQKRMEEERKRREQEQALLEQQMANQQQAAAGEDFSFEYHRVSLSS
jgi:hypothetical protein